MAWYSESTAASKISSLYFCRELVDFPFPYPFPGPFSSKLNGLDLLHLMEIIFIHGISRDPWQKSISIAEFWAMFLLSSQGANDHLQQTFMFKPLKSVTVRPFCSWGTSELNIFKLFFGGYWLVQFEFQLSLFRKAPAAKKCHIPSPQKMALKKLIYIKDGCCDNQAGWKCSI